MQLKRVAWFTTAFMLLCLAGTTPSLARQSTGNDVAILVVDVFEVPGVVEPEAVPVDESSEECVFSMDGEDGLIGQGNAITSAMYPLAEPHGNLVYKHFQNILDSQYGPSTQPTINWNLPVNQWQTNLGNIWLVAIDTHQYKVGSVVGEIDSAVTTLTGEGVTRFVANMSFGLVPCDNFPTLTAQEYVDKLRDWAVDKCSVQDSSPLISAVGSLLSSPQQPLSCNQIFDFNTSQLTQQQLEVNFAAIRNAGGESATALALLHLSIMRPKALVALLSEFDSTPENESSAQAALGCPPEDEATPQAKVSRRQDESPICQDFVKPIRDTVRNNGVTLIQVASAGNDNLSFPYFPAILPNVLSVGAYYDPPSIRPAECPRVITTNSQDFWTVHGFTRPACLEIIRTVLNPHSNVAEVIADGDSTLAAQDYLKNPHPSSAILGFLSGTSFAAPQVSARMAIYLLTGHSADCTGVTGNSNPPLAHDSWDNLLVPVAASRYCTVFPAQP